MCKFDILKIPPKAMESKPKAKSKQAKSKKTKKAKITKSKKTKSKIRPNLYLLRCSKSMHIKTELHSFLLH